MSKEITENNLYIQRLLIKQRKKRFKIYIKEIDIALKTGNNAELFIDAEDNKFILNSIKIQLLKFIELNP